MCSIDEYLSSDSFIDRFNSKTKNSLVERSISYNGIRGGITDNRISRKCYISSYGDLSDSLDLERFPEGSILDILKIHYNTNDDNQARMSKRKIQNIYYRCNYILRTSNSITSTSKTMVCVDVSGYTTMYNEYLGYCIRPVINFKSNTRIKKINGNIYIE